MSKRSFEMYQYRQVLVRMRQGDSDREIARDRLMGRKKLGHVRSTAVQRGWLDSAQPLPDDEALAQVRAVILYEDMFSRGKFRIKALVPGDSADPTQFSRVYGIGVTAVIDVKI